MKTFKNQIKDYPVGSQVIALCEIHCPSADTRIPATYLPVGSVGVVKDHCADGRAWIEFLDNGTIHTFHHPKGYIRRA